MYVQNVFVDLQQMHVNSPALHSALQLEFRVALRLLETSPDLPTGLHAGSI